SVGQFIQVDDLDPLKLGNLVQVEVVGHHARTQRLGQDHQALVHLVNVASQAGQVRLVHLQFHLGVGLHALEHVQAAAAAVALDLVGTVGNALQLLQHKAGHDQLGVDDPRITNIGNPAVNNHTGVEHQRPGTLDLFRELHVRDDKAELILGLQE